MAPPTAKNSSSARPSRWSITVKLPTGARKNHAENSPDSPVATKPEPWLKTLPAIRTAKKKGRKG